MYKRQGLGNDIEVEAEVEVKFEVKIKVQVEAKIEVKIKVQVEMYSPFYIRQSSQVVALRFLLKT